MTLRERLLRTIRGEKADRVPLMLDGFIAYRTRESIAEVEDAGWREIAYRVFPLCAQFIRCESFVGTSPRSRYFVTPPQFVREVGVKTEGSKTIRTYEIETPKGKLTSVIARDALTPNTDWTLKYPVESLADIAKIRSLAWEIPQGLAPYDRAAVPPDFEERGVVRANFSNPAVCVGGMMSYQYFLELCATEFNLVKELVEECQGRLLKIMEVVLRDRTVDYVWIGGSEWLTPPMGSPRLYEELVQEYERQLIAKAHQAGAVCHIHCHGKIRSTLARIVERGADLTEPVEPPPSGDITFAEAKELVRGRLTLGGNVEARIIDCGNVEEVEEATRQAFAGGKERMVLKISAEPVGKYTPQRVRNLHRLIDIWEELSPLA